MTGKVAADPCHPMQCRSLQKQKSSRWVRAEFPRCVDDPCVPAFPHKGTHRDLAKLKRLLKILRGVVKASHTCLPFYLHTQNPMVAASKPTTEGDGHQATLKHVVHILKQIGSSFLAKDCGLPTVHELRLYGLILRHANSCMLLYLMEESSKQDIVPAELIDHAR
uniref:Uncharacterized protein n=1 Tax=Anthurium amnicola TaxID=1678845 RepID=A0A1D1XVB2_9ARAE